MVIAPSSAFIVYGITNSVLPSESVLKLAPFRSSVEYTAVFASSVTESPTLLFVLFSVTHTVFTPDSLS